ncbi:MAG: LppX_LprAFG lipoprotein [Thermomicrobiales bacterium]
MTVRTKGSQGIGVIALIILGLLLGSCGGKKATATPNVSAPAIAATAVATVAATAPPATAPPATATSVPATPTPLAATSTAIVATGTALSATSSAFVGTATPGSSQISSAAVTDPQAQAAVDKARTRFDQVNALHFALTVDGDVYLDTLHAQKLKSADGDLIRPDKVSLTAKASVGPINAQIKFIQIGDQAYLTNILTGKWEKAPAGFAYDPRIVFDQDRGVSAIMGKVRGWTVVGNEKVNGIDTQHVRGPVPVASVNDLVSSSLRGDNVDVDLYIEAKNNDVVRFVLSEQPAAVAPGSAAARWTLDLSKQNDSTIKIDPPTIG